MDLRQVFAADLRRFRNANGLSQNLTYEADVNRSYMSTLEEGRKLSGLEIIGKLATVLEVEPAELLRLPAMKKARRRRCDLDLVGPSCLDERKQN
jgi:transcriptional regulator with XRE-family HTH domain